MDNTKEYEGYRARLTEASVHNAFEESTKQAEQMLEDEDKISVFLDKVEEKFASIKVIGKGLSKIPVMIQLIRSYLKKEYTDIPAGSLAAIIGALIYFLSPVDLIPDFIPGIGKVDDALVIAAALKLVSVDLECYEEWRRKKTGKRMEETIS